MASLDRSFVMDGSPHEAQERFRDEVGTALQTMGFRLVVDIPGHLEFDVRYMGGILWLGLISGIVWLWRKARGYMIEADFMRDDSRTKVEIYGKAAGDVAALINVLGRQGHWPSNPHDPTWVAEGLAEPAPDELASWDDEEINPAELDRTTRRALRKAGRLSARGDQIGG